MPPIIITGSAGFIGFHLAKKLLEYGFEVVGIDNLNDYYDINLKKNRLNNLQEYKNFIFNLQDLIDLNGVNKFSPNVTISTLPVLSPLPNNVPSTLSAPAICASSAAATPVPRSLCGWTDRITFSRFLKFVCIHSI